MKLTVGAALFLVLVAAFGFGRSRPEAAQPDGAPPQAAQPAPRPAAPAPPSHYQVVLRYRIVATRDQHVVLYDRLVKHLQKLGFEFQPPLDQRPQTDRIDPSKNEFRGRLPAAQVGRVRDNPNVAGMLLIPDGFKLPDEANQPVRVRVELAGGLNLDRQRELAEQTKLLLGVLGFKEAGHYDHRGVTGRAYTKLTGTLPRGQLAVLLKDLRTQPGGWFAPQIAPAELPLPLQMIDPILFTEVLTDLAPIQDAAEPAARMPEYLEKIGPGLWEIVNDKAKEQDNVRVQALFAGSESPAQLRQTILRIAPGAFVEGVLGSYVTAQMTAAQVKTLAALPEAIAIRLPTPAVGGVDPTLPALNEAAKVLEQTGLTALHQRGKRGQGVRLAIVDADFRGWEDMVKAGKLPPATRLVDLTTQYSPDLVPAPQAVRSARSPPPWRRRRRSSCSSASPVMIRNCWTRSAVMFAAASCRRRWSGGWMSCASRTRSSACSGAGS
jgi:hypothetical protein